LQRYLVPQSPAAEAARGAGCAARPARSPEISILASEEYVPWARASLARPRHGATVMARECRFHADRARRRHTRGQADAV